MEHQGLYVVDNSSENQTVKRYLTEWCQVSKQMDIATVVLCQDLVQNKMRFFLC